MPKEETVREPRRGIHDIWWNAYMVKGAQFAPFSDIPVCPTTAKGPPSMIITYSEAVKIYHQELRKGNKDFLHMAFVSFYEDDDYDSSCGIWFRSGYAYRILKHFAGIITPDFSTYQDFPMPLKMWNTYRMRAYGYWYGTLHGHEVINNVRWGGPETYSYCFNGVQENSIVAVGTVGGNPSKLIDRSRFEEGLHEMIRRLAPHTIVIYGSAKYRCLEELKRQGIRVLAFPGKTCSAFQRRKDYEQTG